MKNMLDDSDDMLKDRLQNFREDPDDSLWDDIGARIESDGQVKNLLSRYQESPDENVWASIGTKIDGQRAMVSFDVTGNAITILALLLLFLRVYPVGSLSAHSDRLHTIAGDTVVQITAKEKPEVLTGEAGLSIDKTRISGGRDEKLGTMMKYDSFNSNSTRKRETNSADGTKILSTENKTVYPRSQRNLKGVSVKQSETVSRSDGDKSKNIMTDATIQETISNDRKDEQKPVSAVGQSELSTANTESSEITSASTNNDNDGFGDPIHKPDSGKKILPVIPEETIKKNTKTETPSEKSNRSHLGSGFYVLAMPTFGYQQIDPVKDDNILIQGIQKVSAFSFNRLGIRAELGWEKKITNRFSVNVGALYYQRKQTIRYSFTAPSQPDLTIEATPYTYTVQATSKTSTFEYELKNVGILSGINYEITGEKISHKLGLAIEFHKALAEINASVSTGTGSYLFGNLYYRASYRLSKRIDFILQPTFNYAFNVSEQLNAPFYVKPYGLGLSVGAYFKLGKDQ